MPSTHQFVVEATLFDMDGTLTDSIAAVESAWGKVAKDIGQDPAFVIAATHGKRAVDNLAAFKSHITPDQMEAEVEAFENTILYYADAYNKHGPGSQLNSPWESVDGTPALSPGSSVSSSRANSMSQSRRPSFGTNLQTMLGSVPEAHVRSFGFIEEEDEDPIMVNLYGETKDKVDDLHVFEAWEVEAQSIDRSVIILPGVRKLMDSIPAGRYAVATSGAKTYAYGCMTRVGITPPPVTITADDKRLKAGKPAPDPFLLAAKCLGYKASDCVVFEDSPSGIRAGVASGAITVALCTSHERSKIENCGAHFIVENMEDITCDVEADGRLRFTVTV